MKYNYLKIKKVSDKVECNKPSSKNVLGAKLVLKGWHRAKFGEKCFIKQS
jgi:hypothetical protein